MNIDNWPMDRIMRLPDWCFGRRWWVGDIIYNTAGQESYALGEEKLPDKFVLWGVLTSAHCPNCLEALRLTIRLSERKPISAADANTMERLLKGIATIETSHELNISQNGITWINCERMIIESSGRRMAYAAIGDGTIGYQITTGILISSMPKEVPDWLISGQGRNLL